MNHTKKYWPYLLAGCLLAFLIGCTTNPVQVVNTAETPSQKAFAIEAVYNALLEEAVEIENDTSDEIAGVITPAIDATAPVMAELNAAHIVYLEAKAEREKLALAAESDPLEEEEASDWLTVVALNLDKWLAEGAAALTRLKAAF